MDVVNVLGDVYVRLGNSSKRDGTPQASAHHDNRVVRRIQHRGGNDVLGVQHLVGVQVATVCGTSVGVIRTQDVILQGVNRTVSIRCTDH